MDIHRKNEFEARMGLIKMFDLHISCINQTDAQLTALVLDAHRQSHDDEFKIEFPPTMQIDKYKECVRPYQVRRYGRSQIPHYKNDHLRDATTAHP